MFLSVIISIYRSRKRRTSYTQDDSDDWLDSDGMNECNAALVLMSLSGSPNSPHQGNMSFFLPFFFLLCFVVPRWHLHVIRVSRSVSTAKKSRRGVDDLTSFCPFLFLLTINCFFFCFSFISLLQKMWNVVWELLGTSPGDRSSIQSDSGSSSPPLSDDGNVSSSSLSSNDQKYIIKQNNKLQINHHNPTVYHPRRGQRTTSLSTSDEGIVMDYGEELARKRRVSRHKKEIIFPFFSRNYSVNNIQLSQSAAWFFHSRLVCRLLTCIKQQLKKQQANDNDNWIEMNPPIHIQNDDITSIVVCPMDDRRRWWSLWLFLSFSSSSLVPLNRHANHRLNDVISIIVIWWQPANHWNEVTENETTDGEKLDSSAVHTPPYLCHSQAHW